MMGAAMEMMALLLVSPLAAFLLGRPPPPHARLHCLPAARSRSKLTEDKGDMVAVLCLAKSRALRPQGTFLRGWRVACVSSPPLAHVGTRTHIRTGRAALSIVAFMAMAMLHRQTRAASLPSRHACRLRRRKIHICIHTCQLWPTGSVGPGAQGR